MEEKYEYKVFKFGGKCLADLRLVKEIADFIKIQLDQNRFLKLVVVVSAMGESTDQTLADLTTLSPTKEVDPMIKDMAMQSGEVISSAYLSAALGELNIKARPVNALQAGICTQGDHLDARITEIKKSAFDLYFKDYNVLVVTGFQGIHQEKPDTIVTLGRGGSDTTAVAIAACLDSCKCVFFKKAAGITAFDPEISEKASVLDLVSYGDALVLTRYGYMFLHPRCLEIAERFGIELEFRASPGLGGNPEVPGTVIGYSKEKIEAVDYTFTAIAVKSGITIVTIDGVPNKTGWSEKIYNIVKNANLLDTQQISIGDRAIISMIMTDHVYNDCVKKKISKIEKLNKSIKVIIKASLVNITFIDSKMMNRSGYAYTIGKIFRTAKVNLEDQYSSENCYHNLVSPEHAQTAVFGLANHYNLLGN